jgi:hypothetical protein
MSTFELDFIANCDNLNWNWADLSCRADLTIEFVVAHQDFPWSWQTLSSHNTIGTITNMVAYPDLPWSLSYDFDYSKMPDISFEFILMYHDCRPHLNWVKLSRHEHIGTWANVQAYPHLPWVWRQLACNMSIPLDVVLADPARFNMLHNIDDEDDEDEDYNFTDRRDITFQIIVAHPEIRWNWFDISSNPNITYHAIKTNLHLRWDWHQLTHHKHITVTQMLSTCDDPHTGFRWDFFIIASRIDFTIDMLPRLRMLPSFRRDVVENEPLLYRALSRNTNLTSEYVLANQDLPWEWGSFFSPFLNKPSPNVSKELIRLAVSKQTDDIKQMTLLYPLRFNRIRRIQSWWKCARMPLRLPKLATTIRAVRKYISCPYLATDIVTMAM